MSVKVDTVFSIAVETTGFNRHGFDKSTGHQLVSIALIAADATTFKAKDALSFTIKWNGESDWSEEAQSIHHISKDEGDVTEEEAAALIAQFFLNHNELEAVVALGQNFDAFTYWFLRSILDKYGFREIVISARSLDTFTISKTLFDLDSQKQLFKFLQMDKPKDTLDKSKAYLKLFRITKKLWAQIYET